MKDLKDMNWMRVNHGPITAPLIDYLEDLINTEQEKGHKVKISIGTDSQETSKGYKYATAIVLEMMLPMGLERGEMTYKGLGGKVMYAVDFEKYKPKIQERMLKEVQMSIDVGYYILDLVQLYEVELEIHADVNPNPRWDSNVALKSAVGFMEGMGFKYKVKPDAYAASTAADKVVNGKK